MCWGNSNRNTFTISYLSPYLISIPSKNTSWAIGFDKSNKKLWWCKLDKNNDIQYCYPILVLEAKKDDTIIMVIQFNKLVEQIYTFTRLNSGKIMASSFGDRTYFTDGPTIPFVKQGHLEFDLLDDFFSTYHILQHA